MGSGVDFFCDIMLLLFDVILVCVDVVAVLCQGFQYCIRFRLGESATSEHMFLACTKNQT